MSSEALAMSSDADDGEEEQEGVELVDSWSTLWLWHEFSLIMELVEQGEFNVPDDLRRDIRQMSDLQDLLGCICYLVHIYY